MSDWKLYLDDTRTPSGDGWTVARTFREAIRLCEENGPPSEVSFDHDLGEQEPSGLDVAREMIRKGYMPPKEKTNVHSANPVGSENIRKVIEDNEAPSEEDWIDELGTSKE